MAASVMTPMIAGSIRWTRSRRMYMEPAYRRFDGGRGGTARKPLKIDVAMNYRDHIERDPRVVGGQPVLKGTRVTLRTVLASLAEGATTAEILADFPTLCDDDVRAAIAFAATSAQEDLPVAESPIR